MTDPTKDAPADVVGRIDAALLELANLEALVTTFNADKQPAVEEVFQRVAQRLQELDVSAGCLQGMEIPLKLLDWVDEGKDPDAFYKQLFQEAVWSAQTVKGKLQALADAKACLKAELDSTACKEQ